MVFRSKRDGRQQDTTSKPGGSQVLARSTSAERLTSRSWAQLLYDNETDFPPLAPIITPSRQESISLDISRRSTPPVPPGFESRVATPSVPPGLSKPSAIPADLEGLGMGVGPSSRPSSRSSLRHITPVVPLRPATPLAARPGTPAGSTRKEVKEEVQVETPTRAPRGSGAVVKGVRVPAAEMKDVFESEEEASEAVGPKARDARGNQVMSTVGTKEEKPKGLTNAATIEPQVKKARIPLPSQKPASKATQPAGKGKATTQSTDAKAAPTTPVKAEPSKPDVQKRKLPGKLDIEAAVKKDNKDALVAVAGDAAVQKQEQKELLTPFTASKTESPSVGSPAVKSTPRTLRVVSTPKGEIAPIAPLATPKETAPAPAVKVPSRQPSVASINLPGTPSSEQVSISDNISMASTSQSRANSPPPPAGSKVGIAPVRAKTKNQLKKERQERAKAIEEEKVKVEEPTKLEPEETAQEAIISRKKKAKKEKEPRAKGKAAAPTATGESTPTASRPASPQQAPTTPIAAVRPEPPAARERKASKPSTPTRASVAAPPPPLQSPHEPSPPPTPTLSAAQLLAELKATAPEIQKCIDSLFRSPSSTHYRPNQPITSKDLANPANWKQDFKLNLTRDEVNALLREHVPAIKYGGEDGRIWDRGMVTPTGAHLRALTQELETRFLELERAIRDLPDELRFRPTKPQNDMKFPAIDLEALKRQFDNSGGRGANVMEQMVQDGSTMKKGAFLVDEASKYIDEFVMPPATPPPTPGNAVVARGQQAGAVTMQGAVGGELTHMPSPDIAERQWNEAKRVADERDHALKKLMKRNKRVLGLG
ncbi:hypothetical protein LTR37_005830 [Vermiconidia calcicola]|uniref:Uncharacterized protein n=1 Tax=Vermiconidia calcicola TaxID=1690605 RepID=A0ACC3NIJ6_9PEZI|nr:hypothetical protein LTR37_005830 [Vermiconidia calcicola]